MLGFTASPLCYFLSFAILLFTCKNLLVLCLCATSSKAKGTGLWKILIQWIFCCIDCTFGYSILISFLGLYTSGVLIILVSFSFEAFGVKASLSF